MSNVNIEYKYRNIEEIINNINVFSSFWIIEIIILIILVIWVLWAILYLWPILQITFLSKKKDIEKKKKKLSLQQILITKEIENEIENEIKQELEEKLKARLN